MKKQIFSLLAIVAVCGLMAQNTKTITFTSILDNGTFARLTGVKIKNLTQNWTQYIEYPDTTLTMSNITGIRESSAGDVVLTQNSPNPFCGHTRVTLQLSADEEVNALLYDMNGKVYTHRQMRLYAGTYSLNISVHAAQVYILQVSTSSSTQSIKMLAMQGGEACDIAVVSQLSAYTAKHKAISEYGFEPGDVMQYWAELYYKGITQIRGFYDTISANDTLIMFEFSHVDGYRMLDVYYDTTGMPEGIVWHLNDTIGYDDNGKPYSRHGKIMSIETGHSMMYSSFADMKSSYAFDSVDGEANTDKLMLLLQDTTLSFPERMQAAKWCRDKGPEWYLPAIMEVLEFRRYRDSLNARYENKLPGYARMCAGQYIGDMSCSWWSSTEVNNVDGPIDERNKRKAYASNFDFGYDTQSRGNDPNDTVYLFYNSIRELETWYDLAVKAVKKF